MIVFNPPYLPEKISEFSRTWAAGESFELIVRFISEAKNFLKPKSKIFLLISSLGGKEKILGKFHKKGFSTSIVKEKKIPWETLFVISAQKPNL